MGEFGRKRLYEQFTWTHSEKQLLKAYETVKMGRQAVSNRLMIISNMNLFWVNLRGEKRDDAKLK